MSIGARIKAAREARGLSRPELAERAGIKYSTLAGIEDAHQTSSTKLHAIADALGVNLKWLAENTGPRDRTVEDEDFSDVLAHRQPASLGEGAEPDEYAETHKLKFRAASLQRQRLRPDRLGVCYGVGDSMLPRIKSGDAIMFDRSDTEPKDGKLYVITYDRKLFAKKLTLLGGRWFIEHLNKTIARWEKPEPIEDHRDFAVHGRVRWVGSWED